MLGCGIMQQYKPDQEHIRMLEALATVSSLAFMAVIDFMLAYFGGDWLDRHLETGDHTMRGICIALAVISLIMTYYNLIQRSIYSRNDAGKTRMLAGIFHCDRYVYAQSQTSARLALRTQK